MNGDPRPWLLLQRRTLLGAAFGSALAAPALAAKSAAGKNAPATKPPGGKLPLVLLDPGHGGKDPGAIGISGTYEKHIAFATAQELQRQLLASGRYRVALSRSRDVFIPLEDRVGLAQHQGADLFVSMHADALTDHAVKAGDNKKWLGA